MYLFRLKEHATRRATPSHEGTQQPTIMPLPRIVYETLCQRFPSTEKLMYERNLANEHRSDSSTSFSFKLITN